MDKVLALTGRYDPGQVEAKISKKHGDLSHEVKR